MRSTKAETSPNRPPAVHEPGTLMLVEPVPCLSGPASAASNSSNPLLNRSEQAKKGLGLHQIRR